jgi:hypothetical protein
MKWLHIAEHSQGACAFPTYDAMALLIALPSLQYIEVMEPRESA